jgi:hypothetical protein
MAGVQIGAPGCLTGSAPTGRKTSASNATKMGDPPVRLFDSNYLTSG